MKFGESLYQRSVPKWAAYNVKYNEIKHLIKERTTHGVAVPVGIPTAGVHRWQSLEDDLFHIIQEQYNNVSLFLRSKQGEIERRLTHLDKQVATARRAVDNGALDRPIQQARRYQRMVRDADGISEELDLLSRFTGVQKTAFRKILKKYRKWTGSTALQERLNVEVFSSGALQFDYVEYRNRLATLSQTISGLAGPMLTGHQRPPTSHRPRSTAGHTLNQSNSRDIAKAADQGQLDLDVALETVPYGEVSGSRYYWIHMDDLEEAESLLLRHMHVVGQRPTLSRQDIAEPNGLPRDTVQTHLALYDNAQRYILDSSSSRPSNVAVTARWTDQQDAIVTLSGMVPNITSIEVLPVKRKDLSVALQRSAEAGGSSTPRAKQYSKTRSYLSEHRDVKPLAEAHSTRSRYAGNTNSTEVGAWATLDISVLFSPVSVLQLGLPEPTIDAGEAFPHAVLHIRWEFSRMPEVVRMFDTSHLAESVQDFSLENAAVYTVCKELEQPRWRQLLDKDIRRIPVALQKVRAKSRNMAKIPTSSGPSSTEEANGSVFSEVGQHQSSSTSIDQDFKLLRSDSSTVEHPSSEHDSPSKAKKKNRARVMTPPASERRLRPQRYWNEFDDGDSDTNQEETYAIYIDPDEPGFPGAETVSRAFGSMYDSFSRGKRTMTAWLPISSQAERDADGARTPLLFDNGKRQNYSDADLDSSGSETEGFARRPPKHTRSRSFSSSMFRPKYRSRQPLSRRQKALERTLFQFYIGLLAVAYVLLIMAGILENSGRKKKVLEVDAGAIAGVAVAEACASVSVALICMRRKELGALHWGLVFVNVAVIVVIGVGELLMMFAGRR